MWNPQEIKILQESWEFLKTQRSSRWMRNKKVIGIGTYMNVE